MKLWQLLFLTICISCNQQDERSTASKATETTSEQSKEPLAPKQDSLSTLKTYSNQRFKDVIVEKVGEHQFKITGKAQVFEAAFSWVIEDGHKELAKGHTMTDAGAPEFGNFSFIVKAKKENANSTLHIILYEASPKDGSRQFELPILLY